jgi:aminoglycoside phosphotransferase (APT) family kinase protein
MLTPIDTAEIMKSLARMRLIDEGETPVVTPLEGGISSLIVRATTRHGDLCIKRALPQLKVAVEWKVSIERNTAEVGWMRIADRVAPGSVPKILGEDTEGRTFAMSWLDPAHYPVWKSQLLDGVVDPAVARAVADIVSRMHNACAHDSEIAEQFDNDTDFHAIRLDPYFGATAAVRPECAAVLNGLIARTASTKHTLVHGDVSPKNILIGAGGPLLLDAECAWYGDPAFDLAFCLTHLCLKCVRRPEATPDYLACFDAFATDSLERCGWEPAAELEARTCVLLAGMLLARVDGKSPVEYITEDRHKDRIRRFARSFLLNQADRLGTIRAAWCEEWMR